MSLYGLKQAGRLWNKTVIKFFRKISFIIKNKDPYILILVRRGDLIVVKVYVNDILLASRSHTDLKWLKDELIKEF